ncbi:O-antigen ligase [Hydrogenovibrio crunogenus]|uniref:O-antigen ligase n=1 Tax=Hydrogenovibrio crunogenus TaxID=39765 RepID=A0A4P7P2K1_9GAMM|nr:O-antigen ligase family protein [Hydrogenovibrio crunogenus]QBZ83542.1 O-antigen ligase [Hydrogenovibrio crunogenus]
MVERLKMLMNAQNFLFFVLVFFFISAATLYQDLKLIFFLLVFWGMYLFFSKTEKVTLNQPVWYLVILFFMMFVTMTLSVVFQGRIEQLFNFRYENFRDLIFAYFIALVLTRYRFDSDYIFKLVAVVSLYAFVYVLLVIIDSPARGHGLLETPITRGNMGMLLGVMALIAFFGLHEAKWKAIALVGFVSGIMLSFLSGSRGGWLTFLIVAFSLWVVSYKFEKKLFWISTIIFITFVMLIMAVWDYLPIQSRIDQTIHNLNLYLDGNPRTSIGYRFEMWKAAWMAFLERPLFGWGFGSFNSIFAKYAEQGLVVKGMLFGHPHNDYILLLAEKGIFGFVVVLSILIYPFIKLLSLLKTSLQSQNQDKVFLSLMGIVLVESIMEFMLSDQTITMKYQLYFYLVFILLVFASLFQPNKIVNKKI